MYVWDAHVSRLKYKIYSRKIWFFNSNTLLNTSELVIGTVKKKKCIWIFVRKRYERSVKTRRRDEPKNFRERNSRVRFLIIIGFVADRRDQRKNNYFHFVSIFAAADKTARVYLHYAQTFFFRAWIFRSLFVLAVKHSNASQLTRNLDCERISNSILDPVYANDFWIPLGTSNSKSIQSLE